MVKTIKFTVLGLLAAFAFIVPAMQSASANHTYVSSWRVYAHARGCASASCNIWYWIPDGTGYDMYCWVWGKSYYGDYTSSKWFYGSDAKSKRLAWTHSSFVKNQHTVPYCSWPL